jgi:rhomboid-like protein
VAGTIDDPNPKKPTSVYQADVIAKALRWLRKNVPVNEIQNAGLRAEEELAAMEESILKDSERIGLYKPNSGKSWGNKGETSVLVELKKAKEQERLEEEAREKTQAEEIRENSGTLQTTQTPPASRVVLRNTNPEENALYKKYIESANILPDGIPQMSTFQRLWPAALMLLATFGACYLFTQIYVPPKLEARVFPDMPPSAATIITIIGLNAMVLVAWRFPPFYRFFNTYFITISARPNALSLLGNVFSHQTVGHFAINMSILWFVGTRLHDDIGRANFLALYLCAGVFGSFASLAWSVSRKIFITSSLGASGAICATIAAYLTLDSGAKMQFFGFPPDDWPSITCLGFLCLNIGLELLAWRRSTRTGKQGFDHVAHLGGYAAGIGYVQLMKRRAKERRRAEEERKGKMGWVERVKEGVTDVTSRKG